MLISSFVAFSLAWGVHALQHPFNSHKHKHVSISTSSIDVNWRSKQTSFSPVESIQEDFFSILSHPAFPRHAVRIKKSSFCDGTVDSYTGYIDIGAKHLFFYFFESRSDPANDDVIFWTNGGPGGSSSLGLFMELGPCRIVDGNTTEYNPYSWNTNANIFFIDQPVGVGLSYADYGEPVGTTEEAAKDIAAFVPIFFEHFTKFKGNKFHLTGESYGGRYIPLFAAEVYDQNAKLLEAGLTPINLDSVMIGNGMTDIFSMLTAHYEVECTTISGVPLLDISTCIHIKQALPRCLRWARSSCEETFDVMNCGAAMQFCETNIVDPLMTSGINPYDITIPCNGTLDDALCYPITKSIAEYLSRKDIRKIIGADPSLPENFAVSSMTVGLAFTATVDMAHRNDYYVSALLDRGVRALIYAGFNDWICNHAGNEKWTLAMDWHGKQNFSSQELREWQVGGNTAGKTRSHDGLTFATIFGAGHMVPYDKPKEALEMVRRWLAREEL